MTWTYPPTPQQWCKAFGITRREFDMSVVAHGKKQHLPGLPETWIESYLNAGIKVVLACEAFFKDPDKAMLWLKWGRLAPYGDVTSLELLADGRFEDVLYGLRVGEIGIHDFWQGHQFGSRFRLLVFLDMDGVVFLKDAEPLNELRRAAVGGEPIARALARCRKVWPKLFDERASQYLKRIENKFHPLYVVTSSWRLHFDEQTLVAVLARTQLGFVGEGLHDDFRTNFRLSPNRWREIQDWVADHPQMSKNYVVLDDMSSGHDIHRVLTEMSADLQEKFAPFIVLCDPRQGITDLEFEALDDALTRRKVELERECKESYEQWWALQRDLHLRAGID